MKRISALACLILLTSCATVAPSLTVAPPQAPNVSAQATSREFLSAWNRQIKLFVANHDLNNDGRLSLSESDLPAAIFGPMDKNGDKFLTYSEMKASDAKSVASLLRVEAAHFMRLIDMNKDQMITMDELNDDNFVVIPEEWMKEPLPTPQMKQSAFDYSDRNVNGKLTRAEFENALNYWMKNGFFWYHQTELGNRSPFLLGSDD